jgi:hypothetical protein
VSRGGGGWAPFRLKPPAALARCPSTRHRGWSSLAWTRVGAEVCSQWLAQGTTRLRAAGRIGGNSLRQSATTSAHNASTQQLSTGKRNTQNNKSGGHTDPPLHTRVLEPMKRQRRHRGLLKGATGWACGVEESCSNSHPSILTFFFVGMRGVLLTRRAPSPLSSSSRSEAVAPPKQLPLPPPPPPPPPLPLPPPITAASSVAEPVMVGMALSSFSSASCDQCRGLGRLLVPVRGDTNVTRFGFSYTDIERWEPAGPLPAMVDSRVWRVVEGRCERWVAGNTHTQEGWGWG